MITFGLKTYRSWLDSCAAADSGQAQSKFVQMHTKCQKAARALAKSQIVNLFFFYFFFAGAEKRI